MCWCVFAFAAVYLQHWNHCPFPMLVVWMKSKIGAPRPFLAGAGESLGSMTAEFAPTPKWEFARMISPFCTTYYELKYATQRSREYKIDVLPLQVEEDMMETQCSIRWRCWDTKKSVLGFISMIFYPSHVRVDCHNKSIQMIARKIADVLRKPV